jgi:PAS domain S-box-containing protein
MTTSRITRRTDLLIREVNEPYRAILESAVDHAIFTCGLDGRIASWNAGARAILGYAPEDIIGAPCGRIFTADDVLADVPEAEMRAVRAGATVCAERWYRRRDGTRFWAGGRLLALRDQHGQVSGFLRILDDRSAAKDALDALNRHLDDRVAERTRGLREANEALRAEIEACERAGEQIRLSQKMAALGQLTGGIAHDFNNLLTAILGGLEVTRRRIDDPRSLRLIDSSISAAQRGAKLIAQLLAFARKQNLRATYLPLNALLRDMREPLQRSVGDDVSLVYELTADEFPAMADPKQLLAALVNIVDNAREAMPDGGTLRIVTGTIDIPEPEEDLPAGAYATLSIQDSGTGMTDSVRARLFEPFFTTKDVGRGSGLGLAQVYGFIRQSGGTVRVRTAVGEGTTITFLLPRACAVDAGGAADPRIGGI